MWWKLIVAYIKKVFRYLILATSWALLTWAFFPMLSVPILSLMYFITCVRVLIMILKPMPAPPLRSMLAFLWFFTTVLYSSDVILLLSATPYIQVILAIVVFFHAFEFLVPSNYSLVRLLFNSQARQAFINELRHTNGSQYLASADLDNYQKFAMNPEELEALRSRLKTAISNLPEALKQLHATQKDNAESGNHYTHYLATLTKNQEKALKKYLEIKSNIAEGCCLFTLKEVSDRENNLSDFVILEKHYYQDDKYYAVPGSADVFIIAEDDTMKNGLQPFMNQSSIADIKHPKNRDSLLYPETYSRSNNPTVDSCRYVHYPLEFIEAHPLTLELCEAIEALNLSLDLQHNTSIASHPSVLFRQPSKSQESARPVNPVAARLNLEDALKDGMSDEELTRILTSYAY